MSDAWKPSLYKGSASELILLPRPVVSLKIEQGWKFQQHEVPLVHGAYTYDNTRTGVSITLQGLIAKDASNEYCDEIAMLDRYTAILSKLDMADENDSFEFFLYHKTTSPTVYRKLTSCIPVGFTISCGDDDHIVFGYTLKLFARDPRFYTTAPGSL